MLFKNLRDTGEFISWKEGKLVFRSETLENLATKLERFYNVKILFKDDTIKDLRYTGTLEEVTIIEVLRDISTDSKISYEIDKNYTEKLIYLTNYPEILNHKPICL